MGGWVQGWGGGGRQQDSAASPERRRAPPGSTARGGGGAGCARLPASARRSVRHSPSLAPRALCLCGTPPRDLHACLTWRAGRSFYALRACRRAPATICSDKRGRRVCPALPCKPQPPVGLTASASKGAGTAGAARPFMPHPQGRRGLQGLQRKKGENNDHRDMPLHLLSCGWLHRRVGQARHAQHGRHRWCVAARVRPAKRPGSSCPACLWVQLRLQCGRLAGESDHGRAGLNVLGSVMAPLPGGFTRGW